eukprot:Pgem_evm1s15085
MYPAISLAYEQPESDIMRRKPRDSKKDKLVNAKLLQITYLQIGVIQACAGFYNYFLVLGDAGFRPDFIFTSNNGRGIRPLWDDENNQAVFDNYGQSWTYSDRTKLLNQAQTAYLLAIVE